MLSLILCAGCLAMAASGQRLPDTLNVVSRPTAPVLDGHADELEYGGEPAVRLITPAGEVEVWIVRTAGSIYIAAALPDSTHYWGDDFVISLDPDGSAGAAPGTGDRQWYLRRVLDSSFIVVADGGRWHAPDRWPPALGSVRRGIDWQVASSSDAAGWWVELRISEAVLRGATVRPRLAFRSYNDEPHGWWSWPEPPSGTPARLVELRPQLWEPIRLQ